MPNEPRNKTGRSLREQLSAAAKATAKEKAARQSEKYKKADSAGESKSSSKREKARTSRRRASKEQTDEARKKDRQSKSEKASVLSIVGELFTSVSLPVKILGSLVLVLALSAVILYPIGCTYYQALRQEQRDQAELEAVNARNDVLEAENKALETSEGVETQARKEYGWVKKGEKATVITNADEESEGTLPDQVKSSEIEVPHTWYYDILDIVFRSDVK